MRNASSIFLLASLMLSLPAAQAQWITKKTSPEVYDSLRTATLNEVSLVASRPGAAVPMPQLRLKPADLTKQNVGRDIPFLLQGLPSFTASSDAGNGFGYSYLRFRGMDQTRINVTVNNVALNDPESHGVFWVNTPDLGLNANSLVVQRGVGTSTLGSGAFGEIGRASCRERV